MDDRKGNPSDPAEEAERVRKAYQNVQNWQDKYGAQFSGGVSMQYGAGKQYNIQIGQSEIAQKIVSRPLPPMEEVKALPEHIQPKQSWFDWLFSSIFGEKHE